MWPNQPPAAGFVNCLPFAFQRDAASSGSFRRQPSPSANMKTLYDLLGALAEDDADGIRAAFRKAARANHPDSNPDDPDAPLRFRRIVRANSILSDKRQRAAYDRLLAVAQRQRAAKPKPGKLSSGFRSLASGAISGAVFSAVSIGIYLLFGHMSGESIARNPAPETLVSAPAAAIAAGPFGRSGIIGQHTTTGQVGAPNDQAEIKQTSRHAPEETAVESSPQEAATKAGVAPGEAIKPFGATVAPVAAAPSDAEAADAKTGAPPHGGVKDARYYRERGILAYRSGDLWLALIDFDIAIDLDPNLTDTYIDRAIVLHRMGDSKRALEDVARAKRIDDSRQGKSGEGKRALSAQ